MTRTVTSISVDEDLWRTARKFAIDKRITVSELLEMSLRTFIASPPQGQIEHAAALVAEARSEAARKAWGDRRSKSRKR